MNFLGLPEDKTEYQTSPVVVLPCPFEKTTSFMKGTAKGPRAILAASHHVEFYDLELKKEIWLPGIHTLPELPLQNCSAEAALRLIETEVAQILADRKFPICLGGEHTLSAGAVAAAAKQYPALSILQIDAHADLRESYEGTPYSHACAMRLASRYTQKIVAVGIRSVAAEEIAFAEQYPTIRLHPDQERRKQRDWIPRALEGLTDNVYLTVDIDGLDPALIPATGTPEPGGLSWYETLSLIRAVFSEKNVVAADLVELLPQGGCHASDFAAAKLVYKMIGYRRQAHP